MPMCTVGCMMLKKTLSTAAAATLTVASLTACADTDDQTAGASDADESVVTEQNNQEFLDAQGSAADPGGYY